MSDSEFEKIQQRILKVANSSTLEKLILNKKVNGSIADILKSLDEEQFNVLKSIYFDNDTKNKSLNKQIDMLDKKIKATFVKILEFDDPSINESLDSIMSFEDNIVIDSVLLLGGFVYAYKDDNKIKYILPFDLDIIYLDNLRESITITEDDLEDDNNKLMALFLNFGLVPKDLFKELNPTSGFSIKKINDREYFWYDSVPYDNSYEEFLDDINYVKRTFESYNSYTFILSTLFTDILGLLDNVDIDSFYPFAITTLLAREKGVNEIINEFVSKYNLNKDIEEDLSIIIGERYDYIRFWEKGGINNREKFALKLLIVKKPKDKTLLSYLKCLNEDISNYLLKDLNFKTMEKIRDLSLRYLKLDLENEEYDMEYLKNILNHENMEYDYDPSITEFICCKYCFLYKEKNKYKVLIPNDVKEMIMDYVYKYPKDETLTDDDYVNLYVLYNGVIEKQKLKEMLKDNHNLDYTLKEMDDTIEQVGLKIVGDSYYIPFLQEDLAEAKVIPYKKLLNKYKVLSNDDLKYFTIIDTLSLKIDTLLDKLKIKDYLLKELEASIIILISINEPYIPFLRYFFKSNKIKIKESLFKELLSIIDIYKDDIPIWIYNGYSMREFSKLKQL